MQKTLGGERLGSGKKMKVSMHGYERSTHDLGYLWRSTMSAGTVVPFMSLVALPGDTFDIELDCDIKTHPTIGPLFGSYKVQLDVFLAPIRLYNAQLHNNTLGIGLRMADIKLPVIPFHSFPTSPDVTDIDNSQINPSSLPAYLGIRGVGNMIEGDSQERTFNAVPFLAYWDIYKNYYANKQEEIGAVIHTPAVANIETVDQIKINGDGATIPEYPDAAPYIMQNGDYFNIEYTGTAPNPAQILAQTAEHGWVSFYMLTQGSWVDDTSGTQLVGTFAIGYWGPITIINWRYAGGSDPNLGKPQVATFSLDNIDEMRKKILAHWDTSAFNVYSDGDLEPYKWLSEQVDDKPNVLSSQEGLGLKTYQSDLFNNWLRTEWIDDSVTGISAITAVSTTGDKFTIDALNLAKKVYDMLNRIAVSGGTYDDWLDAVYDHPRYMRAETPMYMGGLIKELVFQEVISNSESEGQPLGTLAGRGILANKHKGGDVVIKVDEPSYVIGIISLTPRVDYSQGNNWDMTLQTLDDLHKPALDEIGFQDLITEQMAWWSTNWDDNTSTWVQESAGKQPAWLNYMTNINKTYGNFAVPDNEMFMTLNRRYEANDPGDWPQNIVDLTTYIDPSKFNFIFAETALDAQNFWAQIAVDITARRKMSAKLMPNL